MKSNILSYADYQNRLKSVTTPEEAEALLREMLAPVVEGLQKKPAEAEENIEEIDPPARRRLPKVDALGEMLTPWSDVMANDNEVMVVSLYAKGMTTRDIASYMKKFHGMDISQPSVSAITDKVFPLVKDWQSRPLSSCYPVIYLDGLHFKVREAGKIASKVAYIALGVNQYGRKEVLGIWIGESEGAKFWMQVLSDLKNRGVEDILIACVDGLRGFPEAIKAMFPQTDVQVCIVHQIRNTIMFLPHKDREAFCNDLKEVYTAPNEDAALQALKEMAGRWPQYSSYLKGWESKWADLSPFFSYPQPIRRMIYTTNAIENLNRQFRKVTKTTTVFPHDDSLLKLLWLAQSDITQNWRMSIRNWGEIMAQLTILFPERVQF